MYYKNKLKLNNTKTKETNRTKVMHQSVKSVNAHKRHKNVNEIKRKQKSHGGSEISGVRW